MNRKRAKASKIILQIGILALLAIYYQISTAKNIPQPAKLGDYVITHFTDGDTFTVNMNGTEEKIRLIGVDTPETKKPNSPVQCFGPEASEFTKSLLKDKNVKLEADPEGDNRDKYNRLLRYAYNSDGKLVNQELINNGYAFAYLSFPFSKAQSFAETQATAKNNKLGLWQKCSAQKTNNRWQSNDL